MNGSFKPFILAAVNMKKYNPDSWKESNCPCPIISEASYLALKGSDHTCAEFFLEEYEKVKDHPFRTPKVRKLLQSLIVLENL